MARFIALLVMCSFSVLADTHYVDLNSPSPTPPYTSWTTAATNIQDAVDAAVSNETVLVADGHYYLTAEITVSQSITIASINGPDVTVVDGGGNGSWAGGGVRCFNLGNSACVLSGFTITKGFTKSNFSPNPDAQGAGVYCQSLSEIVTNCTISGNFTSNKGAGMYGGTANHCIFTNNTVDPGGLSGGGMHGGVANNCIFRDNSAFTGGGMDGGTAYNCTFGDNHADQWGGGMNSGTAINCTFGGNSASEGGGMIWGTAINCTFGGNSASEGGGISETVAHNCIIWGNTSNADGNQNVFRSSPAYCCSPDLEDGVNGNITSDPLFTDSSNGNYRLHYRSPCINAGLNDFVNSTTDLDGNPRIMNSIVDMGGYENNYDLEGDGLPDPWELENGLDPEIDDSTSDSDGDLLTAMQEYNLRTYANNPDSDNDGLNDGDEVNTYNTEPTKSDTDGDLILDGDEVANGLDPLVDNAGMDSDSDGIGDVAEVNTYGTNPLSNNSDGDTLLDHAEIFTFGTDPTKADGDDDGLMDHVELFSTGTDPNNPDSDNDGLTDGDEVNTYPTNPNDADSDDDGLADGLEVNTYGSDPMVVDSDNDGLSDGDEVYTYFTIPTDFDSDDDGASDGDEINIYGTDPNDPNSDFDIDSDGIADIWEVQHFGSISNCIPSDDPDNDLYANIEEFNNDTDPNAWDFYLEQYTAIELVWRLVPGTNYQIQCSTALISNSWENIGDVIEGDGSTNAVFESTRDAGKKFYRVIILPE